MTTENTQEVEQNVEQEVEQEAVLDTGVVSKFIEARGYGFITPDGKQPMEADIFVHHTEAPAGIKEGMKVTYNLGESEHNKQDVVAINVKIIETEEVEETDATESE